MFLDDKEEKELKKLNEKKETRKMVWNIYDFMWDWRQIYYTEF